MPFIAALSATAVTAGTAATATAVASASATAAATASLTTIATNALINLAISAAMSAFSPQVGQAGRPVDWILDPDAPIPFAAGRVGVAGSVVHKATFGPDLMYYGFVSVLSGAGPIKGVQAFRADEESVTFNGTGMAVTSQWNGEMWVKSQLGTQPTTTAIASPSGLKNNAALPNWSASHKLSGKAAYMLVMGENSKRSAYPNGEVKPLVVIEGLFGWDPRLDSTYPGGAGNCRLNNPATWVYLDNPILWGLKWALGLWEGPTGKGAPQVDYQVGGIGAKVEGIDVPAFVAGANVADANGWKVTAYPTTDDDKAQVLDSFLQAGGCVYAQKAGKISCIQRAAPRTSIVTISAEDTAGPLEIDTAASRINRINTLRPRFWSENNRWQMTAIDEVTATAYQTEDGGKRTRPIDFPFVPSATQAAQLAALQIANTREGIAGVIPLKPHLQRITPGDAFTITEAGFVLNGLKCLCLNTDYDPATGIHRVTFVSETDAKYPFALGQSPTAPTSPVLTPVDPTFVSPPAAGDWTVTPRPAVPGGGLPAFDLAGIVSNATATAIIVEFGYSADGPWTQAYQGPPTVTNIPLVGVDPEEVYYVAVSYQRDNNYSARQVYGPYTAPPLVAGISPEAVSDIVDEVKDQVEAGLENSDKSEHLAEVVLETILDEQGSLEREAADRLTADTGVLQESKSHTDGKIADTLAIVYTRSQTDQGLASTLQLAKTYTDTLGSSSSLIYSTKTERANGDATTLSSAKSYTDDYKTQASLTFATQVGMGTATAATLSEAKSYSDGKLSTALNTVYTKAQTDSGQATTLGEAKSYSDGKAQEAAQTYATKTERLNGDAATLSSARAYTDAFKSEAGQLFAAQSSLNGVGATASLALSTAQDAASKLNEARIRVVAVADGAQPALAEFYSGTAGSSILLSASQIGFVTNGLRKPILTLTDGEAAINGNLVVTGSIRSNAITKGASAASAAETNVGINAWTNLIQCSMATGGGEVMIDFGAQISAVNTQGPNGTIEVRFLRDGIEIDAMEVMELIGASTVYVQGDGSSPFQTYVQINTVSSSYIHPFTVDIGAGAGAHTWTVQLRSSIGATVAAKKIRLLETKR